MNRLAVFDCDGTLVDSGGTIHRALGRTFAQHGIVLPDARQAQRVIGLSLTEAMAALCPDLDGEAHRTLAEDYKIHFIAMRQGGEVEEPLFEGVIGLLDAMEEEGWLLAVATGKSDRGLRHCLEQHGIHARFVSLQTADRHPSKPDPSMVHQAIAEAGARPETTVVIGDTSFDMEMAVAAGAVAIGAGWGYHDADELVEAGACSVADDPAEVKDIADHHVRA